MPKLFEDPGVDEFRGLDMRNLGIDEAWLVVTSQLTNPSWLYVLSDDCDQVSEIICELFLTKFLCLISHIKCIMKEKEM